MDKVQKLLVKIDRRIRQYMINYKINKIKYSCLTEIAADAIYLDIYQLENTAKKLEKMKKRFPAYSPEFSCRIVQINSLIQAQENLIYHLPKSSSK